MKQIPLINILEEVVEEENKENEVDETEEKPEEAKPEPEPEPDPKVEEGMLLFPIEAESIYTEPNKEIPLCDFMK